LDININKGTNLSQQFEEELKHKLKNRYFNSSLEMGLQHLDNDIGEELARIQKDFQD